MRRFVPPFSGAVFTAWLVVLVLLVARCDSGPNDPPDDNGNQEPGVVSKEIGPDGGTVTSSDDRLTLTIPEGALTSTETITIEAITTDDLGAGFDAIVNDVGAKNTYELGPDGLQFDAPITARITSEQTPVQNGDSLGVAAELLLTVNDGTVEVLDSLRTHFDADAGTVTVSGEMTHFTPVLHSNEYAQLVIVGVPTSLPVNQEFTAQVIVAPASGIGGLGQQQLTYEDVSLPQIVCRESEGCVEPGGELPLPQDDDTPAFVREVTYGCLGVGMGKYIGMVTFDVVDLDEGALTESVLGVTQQIECTEEQEGTASIQNFGGEPTGPRTVDLRLRVRYGFDPTHLAATIDPDDGTGPQAVDLEATDRADEYVGSLEYEYGAGTMFPVMPTASVTDNQTGESDSESFDVEKVSLTVEKTGNGEGIVTGETGIYEYAEVIHCGSDCTEPFLYAPEYALPAALWAEPAEGSTFIGWSGDLDGGEGCGGTGECTVPMDRNRTITATFEADGASNTLETGVYTLPVGLGISTLESFALLFQQVTTPPSKRFSHGEIAKQNEVTFGELSGTFPVAFSGGGTAAVVDLATDEVLWEIDASSIAPLYGAAAVADPSGDVESAILVLFGAGGDGAIDTQGGGYFSGTLGASYDAVPAGGNLFAGTYILTGGSVMLQTYDPEDGYYSFPDGHGHVYGGGFDDNRFPISTWVPDRPEDNWPATIGVGRNEETLASSVFLIDTQGDNDPIKVADVGQDARKVRCTDTGGGSLLCGVSVFGEDRLALFTWDGETEPTAAGTVDVGDGPVNLDLRLLDNGNVGIVTTGFNDDTVTELELTPGGSVVNSHSRDAPSACESPGHAKFVRDAEGLKVIGTCYDSSNYFIVESAL